MMIPLTTKYRPATLDEVMGQSHIVKSFQNQIKENSVDNCILFVGPAGTGKTTIARIIANELDAEIFELDAASNNGIENIRQLRDEAIKKSIVKKCKCYLIDECHSLSTQAWQAFLKIIEEPPKGVYFIFCTTESQKIPVTILSRVHRYNFDNLSDKDIVMELICICTTEGITNIEDGSLDYIAELSNGCMRQAIMYLDTCINYSKAISKENIKKALNSCDIECVHDFVEYVYACNNSMALSVFETVYDSGVNVKSFISDCIDYVISICRNYLISPNPSEWSYDTLLTLLQWLMSIKYALQTEENVLQYMQSKILLGLSYAGY